MPLNKKINKKIGKGQHHGPFSVKHFYDMDMVHLSSYIIKPTHVEMNASLSSPKGGVDGKSVPPLGASPTSAFRRDDISSVHGDRRSFTITIARCYAAYLFALRVPHGVGDLLPHCDVMATFVCDGKSRKVKYFGKRETKMFGSGWRQFVEEFKVVEGDRLKFKIKDSSNRKLKLKVDILRCNNNVTTSTGLQQQTRGTIDCPIDVYYDDDDEDRDEDA